MAESWERRAGETGKAYEAFRHYREMGPERSIRKAAGEVAKARGRKLRETTVRQWEKWSSANQWVARARAWDTEVDRVRLEAEKAAVQKMREQHITEARGLQALAIKCLQKIQKRVDREEEYTVSPGLMLQLMTQGAQMERLARGEPTEIQKNLGGKTYFEVIWDEPVGGPDDDPSGLGPDASAPSGPAPDPHQ